MGRVCGGIAILVKLVRVRVALIGWDFGAGGGVVFRGVGGGGGRANVCVVVWRFSCGWFLEEVVVYWCWLGGDHMSGV